MRQNIKTILKSSALACLVMGGVILLTAAAPSPTPLAPSAPLAPSEIVAAAPASAWIDIAADDLMVMTLQDGSQISLQLAGQFAPVHVANIKTFIRSGWFEGAAIVRVQDNYVVQWGRSDDAPLPNGVVKTPPAEYEFALKGLPFKALPYRDAYAKASGHVDSWPVATDGKQAWLVHCYAMVGVGRDLAPDTGTGGELYTVIGHAPRHLDRNITVAGRIVSGMENLTARPRGTQDLGFYKDEAMRIPIVSVKLASDMPQQGRPAFQVLDSNSETFKAFVQARANRGGPFFIKASGAVDICNAQAPIRVKP